MLQVVVFCLNTFSFCVIGKLSPSLESGSAQPHNHDTSWAGSRWTQQARSPIIKTKKSHSGEESLGSDTMENGNVTK